MITVILNQQNLHITVMDCGTGMLGSYKLPPPYCTSARCVLCLTLCWSGFVRKSVSPKAEIKLLPHSEINRLRVFLFVMYYTRFMSLYITTEAHKLVAGCLASGSKKEKEVLWTVYPIYIFFSVDIK